MMNSLSRAAAALLLAGALAVAPLGMPTALAQPCVSDYERALALFKRNAGECAKNNKLMAAMTDAAAAPPSHPGWSGVDTGSFNRNSAHDFQAYAPNRPDHRWRMEAGNLVFNCTVPLSPNAMPQNEAFLECARVYVCGAAAASCGIATARQTGSRDCKDITEQCMTSHPIPQGAMGPVLAAPAPQTPRSPVPADPNQQVFQHMSPQCQAQLNRLLEGADKNDTEKAYSAYARLRAECDAQIRHAAEAANVGLPERILSSRAREARDKALSGDPGRLAQAYGNRGYDAQFDVGEVINFGFALLGLFGGIAGTYAAMPGGAYYSSGRSFAAPNQPARPTYIQGGSMPQGLPANRSTISGSTR